MMTIFWAILLVATIGAWVGLAALLKRVSAHTDAEHAPPVMPHVATRAALRLMRAGTGGLAVWAAMHVARHWLVLETSWPYWTLALGGGISIEALLMLYSLERRLVSRRVGLVLIALRVAAALLIVTMLAQPVRALKLTRKLQRTVAIMLDTSPSMRIADRRPNRADVLRLAESLGVVQVDRPFDAAALAKRLDDARPVLAAALEWVAAQVEATPEERAAERAGLERFGKSLKTVDETTEGLRHEIAALQAKAAAALAGGGETFAKPLDQIGKELAERVHAPLTSAIETASKNDPANWNGQVERVNRDVAAVRTALGELHGALLRIAGRMDELAFDALDDAARARVEKAARQSRLDIATRVLVGVPHQAYPSPDATGAARGDHDNGAVGLLPQLQRDYNVRVYTFGNDVHELALSAATDATPLQPGTLEATALQDAGIATNTLYSDYAEALRCAMRDIGEEHGAGVILLGDGRHTSPRSVEVPAERLAAKGIPVCSVIMGTTVAPRDTGVISVDAPDAVYLNDNMLVTATIKADGLTDKDVRVALYDGAQEVDSRTLHVVGDAFRTDVPLTHAPATVGPHTYRVTTELFDDEVLGTNNEFPITVNVTDERTHVLLVDNRPRWEFIYLKNLFASRDKTIALQYVTLQPDAIEDVKPRAVVHASAARPAGENEASALPENEAEWMKFDVIVLGDLPPSALTPERLAILHRFVADRGGALIVIAGQMYMPHAYMSSPLADLLPVRVEPAGQPVMESPEPSFHLGLTDEGRAGAVMRLKVDTEENEAVWADMPPIYWRHPLLDTKAGARVLAYAVPETVPEFLKHTPGEEEWIGERKQREAYERANALIAMQQVALGRVMFFAFDHTWRLRYRTGDVHHHRFWGQVLRWAAAVKLPVGTDRVRLGTDQPRYSRYQDVTARAQLLGPDRTPVTDADVFVKVLRDNRVVARKQLAPVPASQGLYSANLGQLPTGAYAIRLESDTPDLIPTADDPAAMQAPFSVEAVMPLEQADLAADRGMLARLGVMTGGAVFDAADADALVKSLRPATFEVSETRETSLWDSWLLLLLIVTVVTAEWILRKKAGLA